MARMLFAAGLLALLFSCCYSTVIAQPGRAPVARPGGTAELSPGARLLFRKVRDYDTKAVIPANPLTGAQMNDMFRLMGLQLSADKKGFYENDECGREWRDTFNVYLIDLNADKQPEVMIEYGNHCQYPNEEGSLTIFSLQNGSYRQIYNDVGGYYAAPGKTLGYKNFILAGPGMRRPLIKWNGKKYVSSGNVPFGD